MMTNDGISSICASTPYQMPQSITTLSRFLWRSAWSKLDERNQIGTAQQRVMDGFMASGLRAGL
jgi:hypothetical protein